MKDHLKWIKGTSSSGQPKWFILFYFSQDLQNIFCLFVCLVMSKWVWLEGEWVVVGGGWGRGWVDTMWLWAHETNVSEGHCVKKSHLIKSIQNQQHIQLQNSYCGPFSFNHLQAHKKFSLGTSVPFTVLDWKIKRSLKICTHFLRMNVLNVYKL